MSGSGLLYGGIGAIVLAILGLAAALMPTAAGKAGRGPGTGRDRQTVYARTLRLAAAALPAAPSHFKLPGWMQDMAVRLSPSGVGN